MAKPTNVLGRLATGEPRTADRGAPETLAVLLAVGLTFVTPLLGWLLARLGVPSPFPLLGATAAVGGSYLLYVVVSRRLVLGIAVSFVVTATFAANLPLAAGAGSYPGNLGPQLWLFQLPLFALLAVQAARGEFDRRSFTTLEYVFGAFVLWTLLSALFGAPPNQDTALYFSLYALTVWLGIAATVRVVRSGTMTLRQVVTVFLVAVAGHTAFAIAQFFNQRSFGMTFLGEVGRAPTDNVVGAGPLGEFTIGVYLSGFTGGNGPLSVVLVLAVPVALAIGYERTGSVRRIALLGAVLMAIVLRFTGKDAARGALLLSFLVLGGLAAREWWRATDGRWRRSLSSKIGAFRSTGLALVLSISALFLPSSKSGGTSRPGVDGGGGGLDGVGAVDLTGISIPYFNLQSLGIRLAQYVVGLDIAVRNPVFGIGGANYPYVANWYGLPSHIGDGPFPLHSVYVATLAETGVPGFVLYVGATVLVLWAGWRLYLDRPDEKVFLAGVLAALVGYVAVAFWVVNVRFGMILPFWLLGGAIVAASRGYPFTSRERPSART